MQRDALSAPPGRAAASAVSAYSRAAGIPAVLSPSTRAASSDGQRPSPSAWRSARRTGSSFSSAILGQSTASRQMASGSAVLTGSAVSSASISVSAEVSARSFSRSVDSSARLSACAKRASDTNARISPALPRARARSASSEASSALRAARIRSQRRSVSAWRRAAASEWTVG